MCDLEWEDDGKNNCIDLGAKKLIIRNSKTSRKKKKAGINCNISLPDEAIDTLTKYKTYIIDDEEPEVCVSQRRYPQVIK